MQLSLASTKSTLNTKSVQIQYKKIDNHTKQYYNSNFIKCNVVDMHMRKALQALQWYVSSVYLHIPKLLKQTWQ